MKDTFAKCETSTSQEKQNWAKLLKTSPEKICQKLESIFHHPCPKMTIIQETYNLLCNRASVGKTKNELLMEIYIVVKKNATKDWAQCLQWMKGVNELKIAEFIVNLVNIVALHRIRNIHKQVDFNNYSNLLSLRRRTKKQTAKLDNMLHGKVCSCIKRVKTRRFLLNKKSRRTAVNRKQNQNPYAICVSSIYNKRGMPGKPNAPKLCNKFD